LDNLEAVVHAFTVATDASEDRIARMLAGRTKCKGLISLLDVANRDSLSGYDAVVLLSDDSGYYTCMFDEISLMESLVSHGAVQGYAMVSHLSLHAIHEFRLLASIWRTAWSEDHPSSN